MWWDKFLFQWRCSFTRFFYHKNKSCLVLLATVVTPDRLLCMAGMRGSNLFVHVTSMTQEAFAGTPNSFLCSRSDICTIWSSSGENDWHFKCSVSVCAEETLMQGYMLTRRDTLYSCNAVRCWFLLYNACKHIHIVSVSASCKWSTLSSQLLKCTLTYSMTAGLLWHLMIVTLLLLSFISWLLETDTLTIKSLISLCTEFTPEEFVSIKAV